MQLSKQLSVVSCLSSINIRNTEEAKGVLARILPLRCFLIIILNYIHFSAIIMQRFSYIDKKEVFQQNCQYYLPSLPVGSIGHYRMDLLEPSCCVYQVSE